jgi:hypothetical protein
MDKLTTPERVVLAIDPECELLLTTRIAGLVSDRLALRRVGAFLSAERIRASARRGWITWAPPA